jgi:hypothetical protein
MVSPPLGPRMDRVGVPCQRDLGAFGERDPM